MIRPLLPLLALLVSTAATADSDPRLASRLYNDNEVIRIDGKLGVQASIAFDEDELIENVAIGDSASWQVTPNKRANLLFVKPLAAKARTNMTVVTDRHTYFFDLVASPSAQPLYVLRFTYPDTPKQQEAGAAPLTGDELLAIDGGQPKDPASLNFAWRTRGPGKLLPHRVYDDGSATYLSWGAKQQLPAILVRNAKGEEGPVNYSVRDDVIVIDEVPPVIILRSGSDSATLERERQLADKADSDAQPRLAAAQDEKE